jgi:hypothetical protein
MNDKSSHFWKWVFVPLACLIAYQLSMGPLLWWEQHATSQAQFKARLRFRAGMAVPLRWAQHTDPTGLLSTWHTRYMHLWADPEFSSGALPER